ncbi:hypothetical protein E2C01_098237 [Portunus trituberculatus]|uniref:Uncharacterized protein n=1 Tax=Portunus trituberculatus TaxID=210409 RepID=A0A5B7K0Q8_PORTR|nr:hypothetical protein [Portunus trituberculatus]
MRKGEREDGKDKEDEKKEEEEEEEEKQGKLNEKETLIYERRKSTQIHLTLDFQKMIKEKMNIEEE